MKSLTYVLTEIVADAFEKCGYDRELGIVTVSDRPDLCQFQCNGSFDGAKKYRKAPFVIADEVADVLNENSIFKSVEVVKPGFINLTLIDDYLLQTAKIVNSDIAFGIPQTEKDETIIIDYGGANVAKQLHVGHLRSAIIGESFKRIARATGRKVIGDVHLGDWGLQIGLVIAELSERYPEWPYFNEIVDDLPKLDVNLLNEIYPYASKRSKEDEEFNKKAHNITAQLQNGNPGYIALWKEIMRVSVADIKKNYEKLNVSFDLWYGESDAEKYVDELIERLNEKGLLYESDGAKVVDVALDSDKAPMPPVIIKKSDGSNMYATTDLATIIQREKDYEPDEIWYTTDKRQELHFTQVFRCAKKAELIPESTKLGFYGFGSMNGKDGKPYKTRDGGVMRLSDLIETVTNAASEKMKDSEYISEEEKEDTARKIGIAALKFGDLVNHRAKDYIFDLDKFLSFEGKTGTYLLYTVTRINSILKKENVDENAVISLQGIYSDIERELLLALILSGNSFECAYNEKAPNYICENAYKLASLFSSFYHDNHIATEEDPKKKETWLSLCLLTKKMIVKHLDVLGIDTVERM